MNSAPQPAADLPVRAYAERIVDAVRNNPITIVIGETGSGKTTQISQAGHAALHDGMYAAIACKWLCTTSSALRCNGPARNADPSGGRRRRQGADMRHAATPCGEHHVFARAMCCVPCGLPRGTWCRVSPATTHRQQRAMHVHCLSSHPPGGRHGGEAGCRGAGYGNWPRGGVRCALRRALLTGDAHQVPHW
jgi:hypothetical protein